MLKPLVRPGRKQRKEKKNRMKKIRGVRKYLIGKKVSIRGDKYILIQIMCCNTFNTNVVLLFIVVF